MSDTSTTGTEPTGSQVVELSFTIDEDHCTYDPKLIAKSLSDDERSTIRAVLGESWDECTTSTPLYCAVEDLEESGHADVGARLSEFIHAEHVFGCLCPGEARSAFEAAADAAFDSAGAAHPAAAWWDGERTYVHGLYVSDIIDSVGHNFEAYDYMELRVMPDATVHVKTSRDDRTLHAFTTVADAAFVQHLDVGDIWLTSEGASRRADVADWFDLPPAARTVIAEMHLHDASVSTPRGTTRRARDLSLAELRAKADDILALPPHHSQAVVTLMAGASATVDELIAALQASCLTS